MAIYVKVDGIDGTATHEKHKKWLYVDSVQWGVGRGISVQTGRAFNRESSEPSVSEVTITKTTDGSSPKLFQLATGMDPVGKKVVIDLVTSGSPGETFLTYTLTNSLVSSYSASSGGEAPSESISFNFTKIEVKYIPQDEKMEGAAPIIASYDLATTKVG